MLHVHGLLESLFPVLEDFLLYDFLLKNLVIKRQRLPVDQIIIQTFTVGWLNYVTF